MFYIAFLVSFLVVFSMYFFVPVYKERGIAASFGAAFSIVGFIVLVVLIKQGTNTSLIDHAVLFASIISPIVYVLQLIIRFGGDAILDLLDIFN